MRPGSRERLLLALAAAFAAALPSPAAREALRIATYNVENYLPADRMTAAGFRPVYPKPEREKAALRAVIREIAADVLVMQEMGPRAYLEELRRDLRAEGTDYPYTAWGRGADAERHLAILSRLPLETVRMHDDLAFPYLGARESVKRGLLEASVETAAGPVTIFTVHLKSRLTESDGDPASAIRRAAEAVAIRDRVLARFPDPAAARFVLLGDCNDGRNSRAVAALQKRGRVEIATLLPAADSRGESWTHAWRREDSYSRVDLILVSGGLLPSVFYGVSRIHDSTYVRSASDHRPVYIDIKAR